MAIGDEHEAYVEIKSEYGRLAGGTRDEIEAYWKRTASESGACHARMVLRDGTVLAERSPGSDYLRKRVTRRLAAEPFDREREEDTRLIEELALLLGIAP